MRMFVLKSEGDPIGDEMSTEIYGSIVTMIRRRQRCVTWTPGPNSCRVLAATNEVMGYEVQSFCGLGAGPAVKVKFMTEEGHIGSVTYIVPTRVFRGEFPDGLHEVMATIFTKPDEYVN